MAWISFGALPCKKKKNLMTLASRCCWNRARPWHASELVSFLVGLRTYRHPVLPNICDAGVLTCVFTIHDAPFLKLPYRLGFYRTGCWCECVSTCRCVHNVTCSIHMGCWGQSATYPIVTWDLLERKSAGGGGVKLTSYLSIMLSLRKHGDKISPFRTYSGLSAKVTKKRRNCRK